MSLFIRGHIKVDMVQYLQSRAPPVRGTETTKMDNGGKEEG